MNHTPGPWTVNLDTGEVLSADGLVLATVYGTNSWAPEDPATIECQANARLMAAAPEFLAAALLVLEDPLSVFALNTMRQVVESLTRSCTMLPTADNHVKVQKILESWRVARRYLRDATVELEHWLITKNEPDAFDQLTRLGQAVKLCESNNDLVAFHGLLIDLVARYSMSLLPPLFWASLAHAGRCLVEVGDPHG
jgi:hypothetical protein